ncbi:MAG: YraN family protein [Elainellaceae cyanobacterium]
MTSDAQTQMPSSKRPNPDLGRLGEDWVAQWLMCRGWAILQRRWRCRWGELDLIAQSAENESPLTIFVEVKVRSRGNWDANGLFSITPQKQAKLWRAAQLFLVEHPELEQNPCQFDVALVSCKPYSVRSTQIKLESTGSPLPSASSPKPPIQHERAIEKEGYQFSLQHYISGAFECNFESLQ